MSKSHQDGSSSGSAPEMDTDRLRQLLEAGEGQQAGGWTSDCPSDVGVWHELAMGRLESQMDRKMRAHAESCPLCAAELELAASFAAEPLGIGASGEDAVGNAVPDNVSQFAPHSAGATKRPPSSRNFGPLMALAAALLLTFASALWLRTTPPDLPEVAPPGQGETLRTGSGLSLVAPIGSQAEMPSAFSWSSASVADEYSLRVQRVDGTTVFETTTVQDTFEMSEHEIVFETGVTYEWSVTAITGGESTTSLRESFVVQVNESDQ